MIASLPSSSQEIPQMGDATTGSVFSSTGEEIREREKCL